MLSASVPASAQLDKQEILDVVTGFAGPMVVDADALNALSTAVGKLQDCAGPRLLTPHPGEMSRLWATSGKSRIEIVREFTAEFPVALLLKGFADARWPIWQTDGLQLDRHPGSGNRWVRRCPDRCLCRFPRPEDSRL